MLSDRIRSVLDEMDVTISDVARAGGCTPSNLNRIKNGVRTPRPSSPTIRCLTDGFMEVARQRDLSGELRMLCGANLRDSDDARSQQGVPPLNGILETSRQPDEDRRPQQSKTGNRVGTRSFLYKQTSPRREDTKIPFSLSYADLRVYPGMYCRRGEAFRDV